MRLKLELSLLFISIVGCMCRGTAWEFLLPCLKAGSLVPRSLLAKRVTLSPVFARAVCDMMIKASRSSRDVPLAERTYVISFGSAVLLEAIAMCGEVSEDMVKDFTMFVDYSVTQASVDLRLCGYMVFVSLSLSTYIRADVMRALGGQGRVLRAAAY